MEVIAAKERWPYSACELLLKDELYPLGPNMSYQWVVPVGYFHVHFMYILAHIIMSNCPLSGFAVPPGLYAFYALL